MAVPTISAVMATHRRRDQLPRVVDALLADPELTELVVVVDGCADGSFEYLEKRARADPRIIARWQENAGPSVAQQAGAEVATGDVLLMFDDDQIAGPGLAGGHARRHAGETGLVVVGYVPPPPPGPEAWWHERGYAESYEDACHRFEEGAPVLPELWGGNLSIRRDDLLRVGWHNPRFPYRYHYDMEFGLRCMEAGLRGVYDGSLTARHEYRRAFSDFARESRERGRAMRRIAELHPDAPTVQEDLLGVYMRPWIKVLSRRSRSSRALVTLGTLGTDLGHRLGFRRFESRFGMLVLSVEGYRGALEESARLKREAP